MRHPFYPGPGYGTSGLWWLHGLFSLLAVVALVIGAVLLVRLILRGSAWRAPWPRHPAIDELDLRYVRGEIDRAEYLQRRADLLGHSDRPAPPPAAGPPPASA